MSGSYVSGLNIPGLVAISIFIGVSAALLPGKVELLKGLIEEINHVTMKITSWVVGFSPIGVFFLILSRFVDLDISIMLQQMGLFFITVILGMAIHMALIMPLLSFCLTRKNPYRFIGNMGEAIAMAFGTASSSATLPLTMRCCEENNGIHYRIVRFVIPIGATINMNGTALYEAVAAVFISQVRGTALNFGHYVIISLTTTAASVGAAGIPQAGVVTMVMVLDAIGLPPEDISLVIAVDWILDRFRTIVNILGDAFGAQVLEYLCRNELNDEEYDPEELPVED